METDFGELKNMFRGDPTRLRQVLLNYVLKQIEVACEHQNAERVSFGIGL